MGQFDDETAVRRAGDRHVTRLSAAWNIGANPNGGYAAQSVLRALCEVADRPDPASVTVHYLRPALGDADGDVRASVVRAGRRATNVAGTLTQDGADRLAVVGGAHRPDATGERRARSGHHAARAGHPAAGAVRRPGRARPGHRAPAAVACRGARAARPAGGRGAVVDGWIRFRDDTAPTSAALVLFADAFPPAVHAVVERVGWVPTLELTVHVRRRPAAGWVQARLECDDVAGGWMIESGTLWDESGVVVARSRQLGMILDRA